jgi:hypothetical protein
MCSALHRARQGRAGGQHDRAGRSQKWGRAGGAGQAGTGAEAEAPF